MQGKINKRDVHWGNWMVFPSTLTNCWCLGPHCPGPPDKVVDWLFESWTTNRWEDKDWTSSTESGKEALTLFVRLSEVNDIYAELHSAWWCVLTIESEVACAEFETLPILIVISWDDWRRAWALYWAAVIVRVYACWCDLEGTPYKETIL